MDIRKEVEKKKTAYCLQNFFIEQGKNFAFLRVYLPDLNSFSRVSEILERYDVEVKYGSLCKIEPNTTTLKWTIYFVVKDENQVNDIRKEISQIAGLKPLTNFDDDIVFLANGYGFSIEYPIIGYNNLNDESHPIILIGGFWTRFVEKSDKLNGPKVTDNMLYQIGKSQGGLANLVSRLNPNNPKDKKTIQNLFKGYGYCLLDFEEDDDGIQKITVPTSFFRKRGRECNFLRGLFEAFFTQLYGKNHKFNETHCWGKGSEFCIFERIYD